MSEARRPATLVIHAGDAQRAPGQPVAPPVYQSATFVWSDPTDGDLLYTRYGNNPNQLQTSRKIAALEGMEAGAVLGSGMAVIAMALLALTESGDHIVASSRLYGATRTLLESELPRRGVQTTFVDPFDGDWAGALRDRTRVVYLELPTNPTMRVPDPRPVVALAHAQGIPVVCDATFASPVNFRAGSVGIDVVVQSATKYLGGHSDLIAGTVAGSAEFIERVVKMTQLYGPSLDPHAAWLLDRGMRTLDVRVERHNRNALGLAQWLQGRPGVAEVVYPGLPSHPDHEVASEVLVGFGGMVGIVLDGGGEAADAFMGALELAFPAPSLGGVETLVSQPRHTSHRSMAAEERVHQGIPDGFVRISVGIEALEDLQADFARALDAAAS